MWLATQVWWYMIGFCSAVTTSLLWLCWHLIIILVWVSLTFKFVLLLRFAWTRWCAMWRINQEIEDTQPGELEKLQVRYVAAYIMLAITYQDALPQIINVNMQELGYGALQLSFTTQVLSGHQQVETLEPSSVILHHSVPMWGSGSPHRGWIWRGISQIPSSFNLIMALATPVTTLFSYKTHHYNLLPPLTMVFTPALFQTIKE